MAVTETKTVGIVFAKDNLKQLLADRDAGRKLLVDTLRNNLAAVACAIMEEPTPKQLKLIETVLRLSADAVHEYRRQQGWLRDGSNPGDISWYRSGSVSR